MAFTLECCSCRFVWDEEKYPITPQLKEIAASILSRVRKIEDDLKVISDSSLVLC